MKKMALTVLLASTLGLVACGQDSTTALKQLDPDNDGTIDLTEARKPAAQGRLPN